MKTLIIGFIVFLGWTGLSSYIYVCKIKGLCSEHDSLPNTLAERPAMPDKLLIYFAFDKSEFISDPDLTKFYDASITYMFHNTDAGLRIIGHTDAKGSDEYNQALGYRRAQSVQNYFESKGIPAEKITIESKGEKEPSEDNNSEEGRAKNRRVIVTIKK
jgi:outer membrane protein OmpA-like peptidoglycan-associated protein